MANPLEKMVHILIRKHYLIVCKPATVFSETRKTINKIISTLSEIKVNLQYCLDKPFFIYYYANGQKTLRAKNENS